MYMYFLIYNWNSINIVDLTPIISFLHFHTIFREDFYRITVPLGWPSPPPPMPSPHVGYPGPNVQQSYVSSFKIWFRTNHQCWGHIQDSPRRWAIYRGGVNLQRGRQSTEGASICRGGVNLQRGRQSAEGASIYSGGVNLQWGRQSTEGAPTLSAQSTAEIYW